MSLSHDDRQALAISYVLGNISSEDLIIADALRDNDPEFAKLVNEIEAWLAPLNEQTPDKMPPAGLFDDIMREISPGSDAAPLLANDNGPGFWRPAAIAASLIAVAALSLHLPSLNTPSEPQTAEQSQLMALLADDSQPQLVVIVYDPASQKVVAKMSNVPWPEDGDYELWLIRDGEAGPQSLGLLNIEKQSGNDGSKEFEFAIPSQLNPSADLLAVSLEPKGGSGTSKGPQGPVLFTGQVTPL